MKRIYLHNNNFFWKAWQHRSRKETMMNLIHISTQQRIKKNNKYKIIKNKVLSFCSKYNFCGLRVCFTAQCTFYMFAQTHLIDSEEFPFIFLSPIYKYVDICVHAKFT